MNPFLGTWRGPDEYVSEVEYSVTEEGGVIAVTAVDPSDGEAAEVSQVAMFADKLTFTALWKSTGRVASCTIELVGNNEARLTFTYTDHARLVRDAV